MSEPAWQTNVPLAPRTTMGVGGPARYLFDFGSTTELISAITKARRQGISFFVLGGGSNIVVSDQGIQGLVLHAKSATIQRVKSGDSVEIAADAGVEWDALVRATTEWGYTGIECMSGIPGSVGAAPVQNIGAYGQEIADRLEWVEVLDTGTFALCRLPANECAFSYRHSRFKEQSLFDPKLIILRIGLRLAVNEQPVATYPELAAALKEHPDWDRADHLAKLRLTRSIVLAIRRKKSMVLDPQDPNTRSCGSFFTNPICTAAEAERVQKMVLARGLEPIPQYAANSGRIKLSAARIVEYAGYPKGSIADGAGTSTNHSLALIARGSRSTDVYRLALAIQRAAMEKLSVRLEFEPSFIGDFVNG
jgi:UDP-N-acetylmuramate dehydrogenase